MRSITTSGVGKSGARTSGLPKRCACTAGAPSSRAKGTSNSVTERTLIILVILVYVQLGRQITGNFRQKSREASYCEGSTAVFPPRNFMILDMISVQAYHRSRGREIVYSYPFSRFTAFPMASLQGFACGFVLKFI